MKMKLKLSKRLVSIVLCVALLLTCMPFTVFAADESAEYYNRIVDSNTMNNWQKYFDLNNLDTSNAGGVWTDKSVFTDASAFPNSVQMLNEDQNFLTALSALAANKEVVGYSTIPTDTVLVLDLSGSMRGSESALINATNSAIAELLAVNENNRVGVVLYSAAGSTGTSTYAESVTRILPIDRYTTGNDNVYLRLSNNNTVSVDNDVKGTVANADLDNRKSFGGGTYIQAGLWKAKEMFEEMDTVIGDNNWQSGDNRMPILVLMSDGAPSTGTSYYADVENSQYITSNGWWQETVYESNVGNGNEDNLTAGNAFLTQLTASYVMNQIEAHYQKNDPHVRGLFYTLGFNIGNNNVAQSVMNPDNSTFTDALWNTYNNLTTGNMSIQVKNRSGGTSDVTISKNSYATSKSYVDEYFSASGNGLSTAFGSIVEEIILQSRYYPTHLEGGSPDFSGYVEFTDVLGAYMEVKHINGILLGDTLYDGHMMASKLADMTSDGLGTVEDPTELGDEFIRAVKTRLGIAQTTDAQILVANAFNAGQLKYNSPTDWSNYIGWYAKADGTYVGFWDENSTAVVPADAVYKIKSYGFLGETTGSIKNSDMMYMSVQVRTNISTGEQTMLWKIPAALVPMVTYLVSLDGANVDEARNVTVSVENANTVSPIRLVFESGLRSDLNELNITRITDPKHIAEDGITRQFWTNFFDISAPEHDDHITALSEFTPSKENERFYYTFDSAVHKLVGGQYVLVEENEGAGGKLNANGEYYHRRYVFKKGETSPVFLYEKMSAASVAAATWNPTFKTLTGETGAYVVPAGTPARELKMYDEQKSTNATESANMVFHPYLTEENAVFYVDMNLGNNGRLEVTPAQGIKLSKTIDIYETGTSTDFSFRITVHNANGTPYTGALNSWITELDTVPLDDPAEINLSATGIYTVDLSSNQTLWLTGIPTGATYTIEEITTTDDYKVKSVHVNGVSTSTAAVGTIAAHFIDDVDFVNTALGEGNLAITKRVVNENGTVVDINDNVTFTAQVTLVDASNNPVSGRFEASNAAGYVNVPANGEFTVTLAEGESFIVRNIPEGTKYTVVETNVPNGFSFNADRSSMEGVIDASENKQALIVNTYDPTGTNGHAVSIDVTKVITGNRTQWLNGESYSFQVKRIPAGNTVAQFTIDSNDPDKKYTLNLSNQNYSEAGTYRYSIIETRGAAGGITYDTAERRFAVVVADSDMNGDLEVTAVNNEAYTTVTKAGNAYTVTANFNNIYAPTGTATAVIDIQKAFASGNHALSGYQFALYDADPSVNTEVTEIVRSGLTDASGKATITLAYAANLATMEGVTHTYYLAEINAGQTIHNIKYSSTVYKVEVTVKDNGDGTVSANTVISGLAQSTTIPTFTNEYVPSRSDFVTISGQKRISTGNRVLNANEFSFVLNAVTANAPMPANSIVKNAANGFFAFDAIEFGDAHKGNSYEYTITEVSTDKIGGFDYDETVYTVTVNVVDNGNGTITANATINNGTADVQDIVFNNAYDPKDAEVVLSAEKILTGKTLQDGEFTFVLTPTGNTTLPSGYVDTVTNVGPVITFNKLSYDKAGVYTYTVTERATNDTRYDFDTSVYEVIVTVTDNSRGTLTADVDIVKNDMPATAIVFRNGFVPTPIDFDIYTEFGGEKVLNGRPLQNGEFEFVLINAVTGVQMGEAVKNDANGAFRFPIVTLPDEGVYHFKISEVAGDEKGITYDTATYHVLVRVAKSENGVLSITERSLYKGTVTKEEVGGVLTEVVHYDNITGNGKIVFNNSYTADPAYVTLEATKVLTGRDLVDGEFKFDLHKTAANFVYDANTLVQDDVVLSLNDDGAGVVTFMPMAFEAAGVYYYVILEDETDEKGITSDDTEYKVKITVTDNHDGNLIAAVTVNGEPIVGSTVEAIQFHNTYMVAATEIVIKGKKTLTGRDLVADEFSFELYDQDDTKLETVKNAADGSFAFTAIPVEKEGTYVYTVLETQGNADGVTYDSTVYTVTVTVTDNLDGTFKVAYAYAIGADKAETITFVNAYTPPALVPEIPQTGEGNALWLWFAVAFVSGGCLFGTAQLKKRKREEN